jgi:hypothetical protein
MNKLFLAALIAFSNISFGQVQLKGEEARVDALVIPSITLPASGEPNEVRFDPTSGFLKKWNVVSSAWEDLASQQDSAISFDQISTPANSISGRVKVFINNSGILSTVNSIGTVVPVGDSNSLVSEFTGPGNLQIGSDDSIRDILITTGNTSTFDVDFTDISTANNTITETSHGLIVHDPVRITSSGTMPSPLVSGFTYFVETVVDPDTFVIAAQIGSTQFIDTQGSGTHTIDKGTSVVMSSLLLDGRQITVRKVDTGTSYLVLAGKNGATFSDGTTQVEVSPETARKYTLDTGTTWEHTGMAVTYEEYTAPLGNGFVTGSFEVIRIGRQVTLRIINSFNDGVAPDFTSLTGVLPARFRPDMPMYNIVGNGNLPFGGGTLMLIVPETGTIRVIIRVDTDTGTTKGSADVDGMDATITYTIP